MLSSAGILQIPVDVIRRVVILAVPVSGFLPSNST